MKFYEVESCVEAINLVFKTCMVLDCKYPNESLSIWTFIQRGIYKITHPTDKLNIFMRVMISQVEEG